MKRALSIGLAATALSGASFVLVLGLWRLVTYCVLRFIPHLVHTQSQVTFAVLTIVLIVVAAVGAASVTLTAPGQAVPRKQRISFLHMRLHH